MLTVHRLCASLPVRFCLAVLSLMTPLLLLSPSARAGTYMWQTTDSNGHVTAQSPTYTVGHIAFRGGPGPDQDRAYSQSYQGCGISDGRGLAIDISCSGANQATFTWQPDAGKTISTDPPPDQVLVKETSYALTNAQYYATSPPTGGCSDGFGVSQDLTLTPYQGIVYGRAECSRTRYTLHAGGQTVTLPSCEPTAHSANNSSESRVSYSAVLSPITINLTGTTPDISGGENILVGQRCSASLSCNAPGVTFSNFQWAISGQVFGAFQVASDQSWGHASNLFTDPDWMRANPQWCWSKDANETVSCTAQASINGTALGAVTGQKQVTVWAPYYYFKHNAGPTSAIGSHISTGGQSLIPPGMHFVAAVGTPALFSTNGAGQWLFVQIINTDHRQWYPLSFLPTTSGSGGVALDNEWPYKAIWSANSTVDASTPQEAEDSPDLTLEANFNQFAISDVYQMYLMYVPPGNNSQYVPLHRLTWNWNANQATQNSNGSWPSGAAGSITISDDSRCYDHPAWQNKYVNPH